MIQIYIVFASSHDAKSLETVVNAELKKVKDWHDINKLSIKLICLKQTT